MTVVPCGSVLLVDSASETSTCADSNLLLKHAACRQVRSQPVFGRGIHVVPWRLPDFTVIVPETETEKCNYDASKDRGLVE